MYTVYNYEKMHRENCSLEIHLNNCLHYGNEVYKRIIFLFLIT